MWSDFIAWVLQFLAGDLGLGAVFAFVTVALMLAAGCCMWSPCKEEDPCFKHDTV